ncbi:hypothetical protein N7509_004373 [Penicillium cosmopolitanum]|uniref:Uncharacterized protein n=1 Tax=Penicillium cosmopolitanum TaxID=1131564 RepID=A0A9X0BCE3_9EURO|nr:uncharacterized protein N7509_004373 [Penicillium cosmopolitanum]KAJ5404502.1 hypothetical protein N7509_004373 [Penicillium cosmopolitanum]
MSTRGRPPGSAPRPTTPPDPTLTTRPVPRYRNFRPICFGQGTASDLPLRSVVELDGLLEAGPAPALSREKFSYRPIDRVRELLELVCDQELTTNPDEVPCGISTWGFWVFVTEYSSSVLEKVPEAMENLVKVTERNLLDSLPAYGGEVARRFKLNVVQDKEVLEGASDDRIREEFKSLLRGLNFMNEEDCPTPMLGWTMVCFVLDEMAITMLANLEFGEEDTMRDYKAFKGKNVKVVDLFWVRQPTEWPDSVVPNARPYRGADECPIVFLRYLYRRLTKETWGGTLEDLFPLQNTFY